MSGERIDVDAAPHAYSTAWGRDPETGTYVLILENEAGEPIAFASYSLDHWGEVFDNLRDTELRRIGVLKP